MSHVVNIEFECNDLNLLKKGVREGFDGKLEFVENEKKFLYYANQYADCDHVIRVKGNAEAYQIGVVMKDDGGIELKSDFYSGGKGLVAVVGKQASLLKQEYNAQVAIQQLQRKGFRHFKRSHNELGHLVMEATK